MTDMANRPTAALGIDRGEAPEGELLIFEGGVTMIVHARDPPDVFPYEQPQMRKVFDAFRAMLQWVAAPGLVCEEIFD